MKYKNILITGGTGKLGSALIAELKDIAVLAPKRAEMDITNKDTVKDYLKGKKIDAIIHCAALTSMAECEKNPRAATETNAIGTENLVNALPDKNLRFIYISTDYVYPCTKGNYSEKDKTGPFTVYGKTKLEGENAVKSLNNYCIIRTSFFNPDKIPFDTSPTDAFSSKMLLSELVKAIIFLLESDFKGIINVGDERASLFETYKKYKPDIKPITLNEIPKELKRAPDSSMNITLWKGILKKSNK